MVMPAYKARQTIGATHRETMASDIVDEVIVADDASGDDTMAVASSLPNTFVRVHPKNRGYGGSQKSCYRIALERGADIAIVAHPGHHYTPKYGLGCLRVETLCRLNMRGLADSGLFCA
jgi:glycosyltransferase involved in cell wall biosynthesis